MNRVNRMHRRLASVFYVKSYLSAMTTNDIFTQARRQCTIFASQKKTMFWWNIRREFLRRHNMNWKISVNVKYFSIQSSWLTCWLLFYERILVCFTKPKTRLRHEKCTVIYLLLSWFIFLPKRAYCEWRRERRRQDGSFVGKSCD